MLKTIIAGAAVCIALAAGPAAAVPLAAGSSEVPGAEQGPRAEAPLATLDGMDVWSADGERIGEVTAVNLDSTGSVRSIYVEVGMFLGLGSKMVEFIPAQFHEHNGRIVLKLDADVVTDMPATTSE